jgi:hypothetical protein
MKSKNAAASLNSMLPTRMTAMVSFFISFFRLPACQQRGEREEEEEEEEHASKFVLGRFR